MMLPSYTSSQPTLLTPHGSGTGTPEEEEEQALLERLEKLQQQQQGWNQSENDTPSNDLSQMRGEHSYASEGEHAAGWPQAPAGDWNAVRPHSDNAPSEHEHEHAWEALKNENTRNREANIFTQLQPPAHHMQADSADAAPASLPGTTATTAVSHGTSLVSHEAYQPEKKVQEDVTRLDAPSPSMQAQPITPARAPAPAQPPQRPESRGHPPPAPPSPAQVQPATGLPPPPLKDTRPPERKSVGQLGVRASPRMKTVTLYDGGDQRKKNRDNNIVDAAGLEQAARTYASDGTWAIDISQKGWQDRLNAILRAEEDPAKGGKGGIDRIMIFDHGWPGNQEFGNENLTPESESWRTISNAIKPHGHIVFMGCEVSAQDVDMLSGEDVDGKAYVDSFYVASGRRRPIIHAYNAKIRHAEDKLHLSATQGAEYSTPWQ